MTTKLEQAARQLLIDIAVGNGIDKSLTALREALAEQAEQEPCIECGRPTMSEESKCNDCHSMDDAAPVEPVKQEPVALRFPTHLRKMWSGSEVQAWIDEQLAEQAEQEPVAAIKECLTAANTKIPAFLRRAGSFGD